MPKAWIWKLLLCRWVCPPEAKLSQQLNLQDIFVG